MMIEAYICDAAIIKSGEADLIIAGGVENMTRAPYVMGKAHKNFARNMKIEDTTMGWRFINPRMEAIYGIHTMPETAENLAERYAISRQICFTKSTTSIKGTNKWFFQR